MSKKNKKESESTDKGRWIVPDGKGGIKVDMPFSEYMNLSDEEKKKVNGWFD